MQNNSTDQKNTENDHKDSHINTNNYTEGNSNLYSSDSSTYKSSKKKKQGNKKFNPPGTGKKFLKKKRKRERMKRLAGLEMDDDDKYDSNKKKRSIDDSSNSKKINSNYLSSSNKITSSNKAKVSIANEEIKKKNSVEFMTRSQFTILDPYSNEYPKGLQNFIEKCSKTLKPTNKVSAELETVISLAKNRDVIYDVDWSTLPVPDLNPPTTNYVLSVINNTADKKANNEDKKTNNTDIKINNADIKTNNADIKTNNTDIKTNNADINTNNADKKVHTVLKTETTSNSILKESSQPISFSLPTQQQNQSISNSNVFFFSNNIDGGSEEEVKKKLENRLKRFSERKDEDRQINPHKYAKLTKEEEDNVNSEAVKIRNQSIQDMVNKDGIERQKNIIHEPIIGTNLKLEKSYLRLTSAARPEDVRPLPVLKQSLEYIKKKWMSASNENDNAFKKEEDMYAYANDQLKSIRQDLMIQHIRNDFTVYVYELHARMAMQKNDLGEYNQCQTQLATLYETVNSGHPMEFLAYRILYLVFTQNYFDISTIFASLDENQLNDEKVRHAIEVSIVVNNEEYVRFFELYYDAPAMGRYLLDLIMPRIRLKILFHIAKSYKSTVGLNFLTDTLGFANPSTCHDYLSSIKLDHNAGFIVVDDGDLFKGKDNVRFKISDAAHIIYELYSKSRRIDIKGQI